MPVKDYAYMLRIFTHIVQGDRDFAAAMARIPLSLLDFEDWLLTMLRNEQFMARDAEFLWEWFIQAITGRAMQEMVDAFSAMSRNDNDTASQHKEVIDRLYSLRRMMVSVERNATRILPADAALAADAAVSPGPGQAGDGLTAVPVLSETAQCLGA